MAEKRVHKADGSVELDVYIGESADRAARQDLPTIDETGNVNFSPAPVYELGKDVAAAQTAVNESFAKHVLTVTYRSCTKQESFTGDTKCDAILNARLR